MRNYDSVMDFHPSLIGSFSAIAGTYIGAPVDSLGFKDVIALLTAGAVVGSGTGSTVTAAIKIQESSLVTGTGTAWTDIANGAINGTMAFTTLTFTGTDPGLQMGVKYEHVMDGTRLRYLRAHCTINGTVGLGPKISVGFLFGRPNDTYYVKNAATQGTGNAEFVRQS